MSAQLEKERQAFQLLMDALAVDPGERNAWLQNACGDDPELMRLVSERLAIEEELDFSLLLGDCPPERLGCYRIKGILGEGGMGIIYDAVREDETQLPVAIKLVQHHLVDSDATRRFVLERRILGRLKHPYIGQIYDSNLTQSGQPYFVMERIYGQPLDEFCRDPHLTLEQRIDLFLKICDAVAFAHQKLVIHRDLKPANILVDERGDPKLLDFGIASLIDPETGRQKTATHVEANRLSLFYAAPEQLNGESLSTACDIYALGIIFCQMLTGSRPFSAYEHTLVLLLERMRNEPPPNVSTLLRGRYQETLAARHPKGLPPSAVKKVRGDLDAIVATCLAYQPEARYAGVAALASDLIRFKHHRPITARPTSTLYRLRCFAQRNAKSLVAAAVMTLMSLFFVITLWQQWQHILLEREMNAQTALFLQEVFQQADVLGDQAHQLTIEQALENATASLEHRYREQPLQRARLSAVLGSMQRNMGRLTLSQRLLEDTHKTYLAEYGEDHLDTVQIGSLLGLVYLDLGRIQAAKPLLDRGESFLKTRPRGSNPVMLMEAVLNRSEWDIQQLAFADGQSRLDQVAAMPQLATAPLGIRTQYHNLRAKLAYERDDLAAAEQEFRNLENLFTERLGPDHLRTLQVKAHLASVYSKLGKTAQALSELEHALQVVHAKLGDNHPIAVTLLVNQGNVAYKSGRRELSRRSFEKALAVRSQVLGRDHPDTTTVKNNLSVVLTSLGEFEEAYQLAQEVLADWRRHKGPDHFDTLVAMRNLVNQENQFGRFRDGQVLAEQALAKGESRLEENPLHAARGAFCLARSLAGQGLRKQAETTFDLAANYYQQAPQGAAKIVLPLLEKAWLQARNGDFAAAAKGAQRIRDIARPNQVLAHHEADAIDAWSALIRGEWDEAACLLNIDQVQEEVAAPAFRNLEIEEVVVRTLWFGGYHQQAEDRLVALVSRVEQHHGRQSPTWVNLIALGRLFGLDRAPFDRHGQAEARMALSHMHMSTNHPIALRLQLAEHREATRLSAVLQPTLNRNPALATEWRHRRHSVARR